MLLHNTAEFIDSWIVMSFVILNLCRSVTFSCVLRNGSNASDIFFKDIQMLWADLAGNGSKGLSYRYYLFTSHQLFI